MVFLAVFQKKQGKDDQGNDVIKKNLGDLPFESKLLPAVLLFLRIYFPKITVTVTVLKFG